MNTRHQEISKLRDVLYPHHVYLFEGYQGAFVTVGAFLAATAEAKLSEVLVSELLIVLGPKVLAREDSPTRRILLYADIEKAFESVGVGEAKT